jgi:succinyl-diaminopimelate desuccinylase
MESEIARGLAALTLELCAIPSETGREAAIAGFVEARCVESAGREAVRRLGNSVVCQPGGEGAPEAPVVALVGHLDTVRCAVEQPCEIRDGRVYGCGASDMKGGVAVMLALLAEWPALSERHRVVWLFYDREEGPAEENGLEAVLESPGLPDIDFAFILEPTDRALQYGCVGVLHAVVTIRGRRAHSARPWQGENALYRAIPLLERLRGFGRREVRIGELAFYEVLVATQAWTANSKNVVPDALHLNLNYRFAPGTPVAEAERALVEWVGELGEVEIVDRAPAGDVHLDHPLLERWRAAENLAVQPKQAWTDVARFTQRGVPAVNFGPGETAQAHQAGEWCSIESLVHNHGALRRFFSP